MEQGPTSEKKWKPRSLPLSGKSFPVRAHPGLAFLALQAASGTCSFAYYHLLIVHACFLQAAFSV